MRSDSGDLWIPVPRRWMRGRWGSKSTRRRCPCHCSSVAPTVASAQLPPSLLFECSCSDLVLMEWVSDPTGGVADGRIGGLAGWLIRLAKGGFGRQTAPRAILTHTHTRMLKEHQTSVTEHP